MKRIILIIGLTLAMLLTACTPVNKNEKTAASKTESTKTSNNKK